MKNAAKGQGKPPSSFSKLPCAIERQHHARYQKLSFWAYFVAQITTPAYEEIHSGKKERVYNFLHVPAKLENVLSNFIAVVDGVIACLAIIPWILHLLGCLFTQPGDSAFANTCFPPVAF